VKSEERVLYKEACRAVS